MQVVTVGAMMAGVAWLMWYVRRLNDPMDYLSLNVEYEPKLSVARFQGLREYDPVTYDSGFASISEFSREYQSSFLNEVRPEKIIEKMARCRRCVNKEFHALRQWLPNDLPLERRLLAGIEEIDASMALAMADVADRFPSVKLKYGAGIIAHPTIKAAEDSWN